MVAGHACFCVWFAIHHACHSVAGATLPQKGRYFAALAHKGKKDTTDLQSSSTFGGILQTVALPVVCRLITAVWVCYGEVTSSSSQMDLLAQEPALGRTAALQPQHPQKSSCSHCTLQVWSVSQFRRQVRAKRGPALPFINSSPFPGNGVLC